MQTGTLREIATEAISYWEPRRILYNILLAAVVIFYFIAGLPASRHVLNADLALVLVLLAVVANVAYCAVYVVDLFVQMSGFREVWRKARWVLFTIGLCFAAILTRFFSMGFLSQPH
jgi:hypothetical protein